MSRARTFFLNTLTLTMTSLLMRTVGVSFSVYMAGRIGSSGMGLYQLIMSVYSFAVTLSISGARLATTRLVVEEINRSDGPGVRRVTRTCIGYSAVFGVLAALALYFFAEPISIRFLGDLRPAPSLRVLGMSLPFLAMAGVMGGYFNARKRALTSAMVQIAEQLFRVVLSIVLLKTMLPMGLEYACLALVISSCLSEILSFVLFLILYLMDVRKMRAGEGKNPVTRLLRIALPDAVSSYVRSGLVTAEQMLIPRGLKKSGASAESALASYGTISGMVMPVMMFPSALLDSMARLLVPELAECLALGHKNNARYIVSRVLQATLLFALGVAGIIYGFCDGLGFALYQRADVGYFLKALAPLIPVLYCDSAVDSMLKGLGQQTYSMRYNIIDSLVSVALVWALLPQYAIKGYLLTIYITVALNFLLSIRRLKQVTGFKLRLFSWLITPILCIAGAVSFAQLIFMGARETTIGLILQILVAVAAYLICLFAMSVLGPQDVKWFKSVFKK